MEKTRTCFRDDGKYWIRNIALNNAKKRETALTRRCFKALFGIPFGAGTSAEQDSLGSDWNHVVRGGRVVRATPPTESQPTPGPVTETPTRSEVTNTSHKGKTAKSASKFTVSPKQAPVTKPKEPAESTKPSQRKPKELVVPHKLNQSPTDKISDLLDNLPIRACVALTRRILTSVPTLPSGPVRWQSVLKTVVLFVTEYGSMA